MRIIQINDVRIELVTCRHCAAEPSEHDAQVAITKYLSLMGQISCIVCGIAIQPDVFRIEHIAIDDDPPIWQATPVHGTWLSVGITFGSRPITRCFKLHAKCAAMVLPHVNLEDALAEERPWPRL